MVRGAKFNKSRELPLQPATLDALASYAVLRDRFMRAPSSPTFFVSRKATAVIYTDFSEKFPELVHESGVGAGSPIRPRIHDYACRRPRYADFVEDTLFSRGAGAEAVGMIRGLPRRRGAGRGVDSDPVSPRGVWFDRSPAAVAHIGVQVNGGR